MITPELGRKCVCVSCAARFYDLTRTPAVCPKCGTAQPPPKARVYAPPRGGLRTRYAVPVVPVIPAEVEVEADIEAAEEDEDEEDAAEVEEGVAEEV